MDHIYIITGPMFAGKSTKLIAFYRNIDSKNKIILTHNSDKRYGSDVVSTHNNDSEKIHKLKSADYIFVDEFQFYSKEEIDNILSVGFKKIYFAGLTYDFRHEMFPIAKYLHGLAANKNKLFLSAVCGCGNIANHTKKISGDKKVLISVGGAETYSPSCEECFLN